MKTVHRYTLKAEITGEIEYDPGVPASYTKALEEVAAKRKAALEAGFTIKSESGKPVAVRE